MLVLLFGNSIVFHLYYFIIYALTLSRCCECKRIVVICKWINKQINKQNASTFMLPIWQTEDVGCVGIASRYWNEFSKIHVIYNAGLFAEHWWSSAQSEVTVDWLTIRRWTAGSQPINCHMTFLSLSTDKYQISRVLSCGQRIYLNRRIFATKIRQIAAKIRQSPSFT